MDQFKAIMNSRTDIANIGIIIDEEHYIINDGFGKLNPSISLEQVDWIYNTYQDADGVSLSTSHVQNVVVDDYRWVITLSRVIHNKYTNERQGIFFIDLNYDVISDLCENGSIDSSGYTFIIDENGQIIYHPKQQLLYSGLLEENIEEVLACKENYFVTEEPDSRLYTMCDSKKIGWTVVGVAYVDELMKDSDRTNGAKIYTCSCGDSYTESIPATGHNYVSRVTKEPTKSQEGVMTYTCKNCGHSYTTAIEMQKDDKKPGDNKPGTDKLGDNKLGEGGDKKLAETPDTGKPFIKDETGKEGWDVIRDEITENIEAIISGGTGEKVTVTVEMNGAVTVPGDLFDTIKGQDITVVFDMGNGITWSVNGKDVTFDEASDINFNVRVVGEEADGIPVDGSEANDNTEIGSEDSSADSTEAGSGDVVTKEDAWNPLWIIIIGIIVIVAGLGVFFVVKKKEE